LLSNKNVTDILVNGHKEIWIDQGQGLEKTKLTFLNVKHKANHAAEEAALITASTFDCDRASEIAVANKAEILTCEINTDHVYVETFSIFNNSQTSLFNKLGIYDEGVIGKAKAK
jgi:hypothetical protein